MKIYLVLTLLLTLSFFGCAEYKGGGEKNGRITELGPYNVACHKWQAVLVRGESEGVGPREQPFPFTVDDEKLAEEVEQAMLQKYPVKITYQLAWNGLSSCADRKGTPHLQKIEKIPH